MVDGSAAILVFLLSLRLGFLFSSVFVVQNSCEMSELFVGHLVNFVDLFLQIELIVPLSDVVIICFDSLFNIRLALVQNLHVLGFGSGQVFYLTQFFLDLFEGPSARGSQIT